MTDNLSKPGNTHTSSFNRPKDYDKSWWQNLLVGLALVFVAAILGWFANAYWQERENRQQGFLCLVEEASHIINTPDVGSDLRIMWKDQPIDNLSRIRVRLYNNTDKDYPAFKLTIRKYKENDEQISVVSKKVEIPQQADLKEEGRPNTHESIYDYRIDVANRSVDVPFFDAEYLIKGGDAPQVKIFTDIPGVVINRIRWAQTRDDSHLDLTVYFASLLFMGVIVAIALFVQWRMTMKYRAAKDRLLQTAIHLRDVAQNQITQLSEAGVNLPPAIIEGVIESGQKLLSSVLVNDSSFYSNVSKLISTIGSLHVYWGVASVVSPSTNQNKKG